MVCSRTSIPWLNDPLRTYPNVRTVYTANHRVEEYKVCCICHTDEMAGKRHVPAVLIS